MHMPRHPDGDDQLPAREAPPWGRIAVVTAMALIVLAVVVLHLTGVIGGKVHSG